MWRSHTGQHLVIQRCLLSVCVTITMTSILPLVVLMGPSRFSMFSPANPASSLTKTCLMARCQLLVWGKFWFLLKSKRWRPICAPGVTKNVLIAVNSHGDLKHYHTTSGKELNKIWDQSNTLMTADYRHDGLNFLTAGYDGKVRTYDE